jgi:hypothetical protein
MTTASLIPAVVYFSALVPSPDHNPHTAQSPPADTDEAARRAAMLQKLGKNRLERRASRHNDLIDALSVIDSLSED